MQYEKEQPLDPPEYHERPEREYDENLTDRFEAEATRDCEAAIASIKSMNTMLDAIFGGKL